ncbi:MAG: pyruvate:ferredoxin (flavodoxin) oxidoreductase [bacterium]
MKKELKSIDGNYAAAYAAYPFTEVAGIYPITPSSPMAEYTEEWAAAGKKNLFGMPVKIVEMQSEAGAAGTVHGSLQVGALTTTYTASQGLLLKIPNMYKMAGQMLPAVIHVSARALAAQSLAIFGDHQDVMAVRQTGFAMLATGSVQEVMDLTGVAHLAAIKTSIPFLHFFDGFRTSHEVNTVEMIDYDIFERLVDKEAIQNFRNNSLNFNNPKTRGTAQNDDVYFQTRELQNTYYADVADVVNGYMQEISKEVKRPYAPFVYYGDKDATDIIIAMGSVTEAIEEVVDLLTKQGKKIGVLKVHLYRPFSEKYFFDAIPKSVKRIAVLDRTIEQGSVGEPLYLDVKALFYNKENAPLIIGGRYGLSSKDTTPDMINAVYENLAGKAMDRFTIGITDDVTHKSLEVKTHIDVTDKTCTELLFFGFGSDGTVGAVKNTSKIIGDNTDLYSQSYAAYDSKKSGGSTRLHLRFSENPIKSTYLVNNPHFVSCSIDAYLAKFDMIDGLRDGGTFLLNTVTTPDRIEELLPNRYKRLLAEKNAKLYIIDAVNLATKIGLGRRTNTIMQSAFFKLNEHIMPYDKAQQLMKEYAHKTYIKKGEAVVNLNYEAIDAGGNYLVQVEVKDSWKNLKDEKVVINKDLPKFVREIAEPINAIKGDSLPLSVFKDYPDGHMPVNTSQYEKRGIANDVPKWVKENCIQCNQCVFVCPHACIRPFLATETEVKNAPEGTEFVKPIGRGMEEYQYSLSLSPLDCTGCGACVKACPAKTKALEMGTINESFERNTQSIADYFYSQVEYKDKVTGTANVKNIGFAQPLFEFSGACAGCGETTYIKTLTQLFGDHMIVANATGCTSIYSGSFPSSPYAKNKEGKGPAWANSLFEDNAEFGFGMRVAFEAMRDRIETIFENNIDKLNDSEKELVTKWIENRNSFEVTKEVAEQLIPLFSKNKNDFAKEIVSLQNYLVKSSQWVIGGDGWAYDIGYGGLDHVIANNEDINILVVDTEVYSNTGGQSSKSARTGSIAKFTAAGKHSKKKDLAAIAMSYGHVYVATISHGANAAQVIKVLKEAEAYNGPSIVIAYSPCIAHGIKGGLVNTQSQAKLATECGYWPIFRFNPLNTLEGKNPFTLDSKEPDFDKYQDFLLTEGRYSQLSKVNPEHANELLEGNKADAMRKYRMYKRYASMDYTNEI